MNTLANRLRASRLFPAFVLWAALSFSAAQAAVISYEANLDGASEDPPVVTPGTGICQVDVDPVAHTMRVQVQFQGLIGTTTACHIHAPTAMPFAGNAGVASQVPSFVGFPLGVTSGTYDMLFDTLDASTYNPNFIINNGGTPASAEAALFQFLAEGRAYLNIHSTFRTAGEIRGFLRPDAVPTRETTWGSIKAMFR